MGWVWLLLIVAVIVAGYVWVRKNVKDEIERYRRIRRANRPE